MRPAAPSRPIRSGSRIRSIRRPAAADVVAAAAVRPRRRRRPRTPRYRPERRRPRRRRRHPRRRRRHLPHRAPAQPPATPGATPAPSTPSQTPATPPATDPQSGSSAQGPQGRGGNEAPPPPRRVELRNLAAGTTQSFQDIQAFVFSPDSSLMVLKRRPAGGDGGGGRGGNAAGNTPAPEGGRGSNDAATGPRGTDAILLDLRTGRHQLLGSVGDIAFNKKGTLLGYTVDATVKDANGLFVYDVRQRARDAARQRRRVYSRLAWSEDGTALAVLKGAEVEKHARARQRPDGVCRRRRGDARRHRRRSPWSLDPKKADGFPKDWVVSDRAALSWSDDNKRVFFGMKPQVPAPPTGATQGHGRTVADVDVWNTADERIQSAQMIRADQDRNFTFREAFDVAANRFVKLADETMRELDVAPGRPLGGRPRHARLHLRLQAPGGGHLPRQHDDRRAHADAEGSADRQPHASASRPTARTSSTGKTPSSRPTTSTPARRARSAEQRRSSFIDMEFDHPGPKPSYGIAGYTSDGKSVIVAAALRPVADAARRIGAHRT